MRIEAAEALADLDRLIESIAAAQPENAASQQNLSVQTVQTPIDFG